MNKLTQLGDDIEFLYELVNRLPLGYDKAKLESVIFNLRGMKGLEDLKNKLIKRKMLLEKEYNERIDDLTEAYIDDQRICKVQILLIEELLV